MSVAENNEAKLRARLTEMEQNCHTAARFGKELMVEKEKLTQENKQLAQQNHELKHKLALENPEIKQKVAQENKELKVQNETQLQELHDLKSRLEVKRKLETEYNCELDSLHQQMKQNEDEQLQNCRNEVKSTIDKLNKKVETIENDLDVTRKELKESERLREEIEVDLRNKNKQLAMADASGSDGLLGDTTILMHQKDELSNELEKYKETLVTTKSELEQVTKSFEATQKSCEEYKEMYEDTRNELRETRERCDEMKSELDLIKSETSMSPGKSKGNSMFAELNDQRVRVEAELVNSKERNDQFKLENDKLTKEVDELKSQILHRLKLSAARGGCDYPTLRRELEDARGEIRVLRGTVEGRAMSSSRLSRSSVSSHKQTGVSDSKIKEELDSVRRECDKLRLRGQLLSEETMQHEKMKVDAESKIDNMQNEINRLKMRIGQTKETPASSTPSATHKVGNKEKVNLATDIDQQMDDSENATASDIPVAPGNSLDNQNVPQIPAGLVIRPMPEGQPSKKRVCKRYTAADTDRWIQAQPLIDLDD